MNWPNNLYLFELFKPKQKEKAKAKAKGKMPILPKGSSLRFSRPPLLSDKLVKILSPTQRKLYNKVSLSLFRSFFHSLHSFILSFLSFIFSLFVCFFLSLNLHSVWCILWVANCLTSVRMNCSDSTLCINLRWMRCWISLSRVVGLAYQCYRLGASKNS